MVSEDSKRPVIRKFHVGDESPIQISLIQELKILPDQMVTLITENTKRLDVTCKDWGFYATPSINKRLADQGLQVAVTENSQGRRYVVVVDTESMARFEEYCKVQEQRVLIWL